MSDDKPILDDYGREFGKPLWPGGPILGGKDWRAFLERRDKNFGPGPTEAVLGVIRRMRALAQRGEWEA